MTKAKNTAQRIRHYVHAANYFKAPDLNYDVMGDEEYAIVGGSNRMRTESEVQAIAREFRPGDADRTAGLMVRLEQAAIYATCFASDDPDDAAGFTCGFAIGGMAAEGSLLWCIDFLRAVLNPPPLDLPAACPTCGRS